MSAFTLVTAAAEHIATCPECSQWLWKIGPASGFFGAAPIEKAMRYLAQDGDTVQFFDNMPAPLSAHTEFDAQLLKGDCPHCGAAYWFVTAAYPEVPVQNTTSPAFICDESYIDIADQVDGTFLGDQAVAVGWVLLRQRARWQDREIRLDVHMIGPFPNGEALVGPHGVSGCGLNSADETRRAIWIQAADLVRAITPAAVAVLHNQATMVCIAADPTQMLLRYGSGHAKTVLNNCDTKIVLSMRNDETATRLSQLVGTARVTD